LKVDLQTLKVESVYVHYAIRQVAFYIENVVLVCAAIPYTGQANAYIYLAGSILNKYIYICMGRLTGKYGVSCVEAHRLSRMFVVIRLTFSVC